MTLDEARTHIGHAVTYHPRHGGPPEHGAITSVGDRWVFVRYSTDGTSKATDPADLELPHPNDGPQPRDLPTATLAAVMSAAAAVTGHAARWLSTGEISQATAAMLLAVAERTQQPPPRRCTRPHRNTR